VQLADLILFMVDVRDGITPLDKEVARRLRGASVPVMLVVNKVEGKGLEWEVDSFRQLGIALGPFAISAENGGGTDPLFEAIMNTLPPPTEDEGPPEQIMKLAIVGQRNAGKSTLINQLAGEERMIVSEIPGTTRDAVDVMFERDGRKFVAIDTAGVKRKRAISDAIEFYADARSYKQIRRADVVVLMFDLSKELSVIDKQLARYAIDHYKPLILAGNKWDLVSEAERDEFRTYVRAELLGLDFAPLVFLTATTGQGLSPLIRQAIELFDQSRMRVPTGELNRILKDATTARSPSSDGHRIKILYATQAEAAPPTFIVFVNDKKLIGKDYVRYLTNRLRQDLPFKEVPLHIVLRDRDGSAGDN
jgi:GTP-binding protein